MSCCVSENRRPFSMTFAYSAKNDNILVGVRMKKYEVRYIMRLAAIRSFSRGGYRWEMHLEKASRASADEPAHSSAFYFVYRVKVYGSCRVFDVPHDKDC